MSLEMKKTKSSEQDNDRYGGEKRRKHYAMEGIVDLGPHRVPDSDGTMKLCRFETTFRQERAQRGRESTEGNCITTRHRGHGVTEKFQITDGIGFPYIHFPFP